MALVTRTEKGSKLTIEEMDGNLTYLQSSSFNDGVYTKGDGQIAISRTEVSIGKRDARLEVSDSQIVMYAELSSDYPALFASDTIVFPNLPTVDPINAGQLWVDTGSGYVLKVSQGE